jgi:integrase
MTRYLGPGVLRRETRARTPRWVLDWSGPDGRRRRQALSTDRRVAEQLRAQLVAQRDLQRAGVDIPLRELADAHLADLATRATPMHVRNVRSILDRSLAALPEMASQVRPYDLVQYRAGLVAQGVGNRTANHHVARVTAMLRWGARMGLIGRNPVGELDRLPEREKDQRYRRRALSEAEIQRFLAAAEDDDARCDVDTQAVVRVPQAPFFRVLLATGARYGELRQATWGDVDPFQRTLVIRAESAKTGRRRTLPLHEDIVAELVRLKAVHAVLLGREPELAELVFLSPEGHAWCRPSNNVNRLLRRILAAAGISRVDGEGRKLDLHSLRHTAASRLARGGVGLVLAQKLLGHADPKLTARVYSHVEVEDLRAAVMALPAAVLASSEARSAG